MKIWKDIIPLIIQDTFQGDFGGWKYIFIIWNSDFEFPVSGCLIGNSKMTIYFNTFIYFFSFM